MASTNSVKELSRERTGSADTIKTTYKAGHATITVTSVFRHTAPMDELFYAIIREKQQNEAALSYSKKAANPRRKFGGN